MMRKEQSTNNLSSSSSSSSVVAVVDAQEDRKLSTSHSHFPYEGVTEKTIGENEKR